MSYYIVCFSCGYRLLKASNGSCFEILCPRCGDKMAIEAKDGRLLMQKILTNKLRENEQDDDC